MVFDVIVASASVPMLSNRLAVPLPWTSTPVPAPETVALPSIVTLWPPSTSTPVVPVVESLEIVVWAPMLVPVIVAVPPATSMPVVLSEIVAPCSTIRSPAERMPVELPLSEAPSTVAEPDEVTSMPKLQSVLLLRLFRSVRVPSTRIPVPEREVPVSVRPPTVAD